MEARRMKVSLIVVLVALVAASPAAAAPDNDDVADARALGRCLRG